MLNKLEDIASYLTSNGKGILAADESNTTIGKRFADIGVESSFEIRRDYREMLFSSIDAMKNYISGVILYDETIRQDAAKGGKLIDLITDANSIIGIKVDTGAKPLAFFAGETITEGLDGLRERLKEYHAMGARFAKWRAVIALDKQLLPSYTAVKQNAQALARYAALCQENGIVPIVEPEILMDNGAGDHDIERCYEVTKLTLRTVFDELALAKIQLNAMVLKPNMVIAGKHYKKSSAKEIAQKTIDCFKEVVLAEVSGIAFLSGGQDDVEAVANLNAMNKFNDLPWNLSFSYGRALQSAALKAWGGKAENVEKAQKIFSHRAKMCFLAAKGEWTETLEN